MYVSVCLFILFLYFSHLFCYVNFKHTPITTRAWSGVWFIEIIINKFFNRSVTFLTPYNSCAVWCSSRIYSLPRRLAVLTNGFCVFFYCCDTQSTLSVRPHSLTQGISRTLCSIAHSLRNNVYVEPGKPAIWQWASCCQSYFVSVSLQS